MCIHEQRRLPCFVGLLVYSALSSLTDDPLRAHHPMPGSKPCTQSCVWAQCPLHCRWMFISHTGQLVAYIGRIKFTSQLLCFSTSWECRCLAKQGLVFSRCKTSETISVATSQKAVSLQSGTTLLESVQLVCAGVLHFSWQLASTSANCSWGWHWRSL